MINFNDMTFFNVFLPIIIAAIYLILIVFIPIGSFFVSAAISFSLAQKKGENKYDTHIWGLDVNRFIKLLSAFLMVVFIVCYFALFNFLSSAWIRSSRLSSN